MFDEHDKLLLHKKVQKMVRSRNSAAVELGLTLIEVKESGAYLDYADSFNAYLAQPETKIPNSSAFRYMGVARRYVIELGLPKDMIEGLDTNALYRIKDLVTFDNYKEWLARVESLSRSDIYHLAKFGDTDQMSCEHDFEKVVTYRCRKCGTVTRNEQEVQVPKD